jgi:hypothetical protein
MKEVSVARRELSARAPPICQGGARAVRREAGTGDAGGEKPI